MQWIILDWHSKKLYDAKQYLRTMCKLLMMCVCVLVEKQEGVTNSTFKLASDKSLLLQVSLLWVGTGCYCCRRLVQRIYWVICYFTASSLTCCLLFCHLQAWMHCKENTVFPLRCHPNPSKVSNFHFKNRQTWFQNSFVLKQNYRKECYLVLTSELVTHACMKSASSLNRSGAVIHLTVIWM